MRTMNHAINLAPPAPPIPPENRLSCGTCGFTATKTEFHLKHPHCNSGRLIATILFIIPASFFVAIFVAL